VESVDWLESLNRRLQQQVEFLVEVDRLKTVVRDTTIEDRSRLENSAEHSWHLGVFAMVFLEYAAEPVDLARVLQMLLIHDIVEIDAGDTPIFGSSATEDQHSAENQAASRLFGVLPGDQATEFQELWTEFEAAQTADARFAKALDQLQPVVLNHVVGGGSWRDHDVDEALLRSHKQGIAVASETLWHLANAAFEDAVDKGWLRAASKRDAL
jgi:putative hydrolase of HD superfamily